MAGSRITPICDFDGYPDGLNKQSFRTGVGVDVPDAYAKLLIAKGVAVASGGTVHAGDVKGLSILGLSSRHRAKKSPDKE